MLLSVRGYARHRGINHSAVQKAISTGRISVADGGKIDPEIADREWAENTASRPVLADVPPFVPAPKPQPEPQASAAPKPQAAAKQKPPPGPVTVSDIASADPGIQLAAGGTSLLQARTINEVLKARTNQVKLESLKGDLINRQSVIAHVFALARAERDAWINWPSRVASLLAAKLNVEAHDMHVALESAVRDHLAELGELTPKID